MMYFRNTLDYNITMKELEIKKDDISQEISAFSVFIDGEEELFVTPLHGKEDAAYHEKLMKFVQDACQYVLAAAKINNNDPYELAAHLNRETRIC